MLTKRTYFFLVAALTFSHFLAACAPATTPALPAVTELALAPTEAPPTPLPPSSTTEPSPTPFAMPVEPGVEWQLVVIGDSSLWNHGEAFAAQIEKDLGVQVVVEDFSLPSLSAGSVLKALQTGKSAKARLEQLPAAVAEAEVVVMFTNPVDSIDPEKPLNLDGCFGCSMPGNCQPEAYAQWQADLQAIWGEIFRLRAGQPTILRATDLYNPKVEHWNSCDIFSACDQCWMGISAVTRQAAEAYGIPFFSRYDGFDGPDHTEDPRLKGYIQDDGEHPTELAGQYAAELLAELGYDPVPPPLIPPASPTPQVANPDYPLAEPGLYFVGNKVITYIDESRGGREVPVTVFYPAIRAPDASGHVKPRDAAPDLDGAPYPLIVSSTKMARQLAPFLVSRGFTWAGVDGIDTYMRMDEQMYEQPLDILFALDQVASNPPEGLEGMFDTEHAGAIGFSFDGYNSLAMSGARLDPEYYRAQCQAPDQAVSAIMQTDMTSFSCGPAENWEAFAAQAGETITASEDGLWQPLTDPRLKAVMPLAAEGWWLFGERGLAAADRPALMIVATNDSLYPENALIFEHLGSPDKTLISFLYRDHMMIYDPVMVARIAHFATAFFGYHLQGRKDLEKYFSEEFVSQKEGLYWGVYPGD